MRTAALGPALLWLALAGLAGPPVARGSSASPPSGPVEVTDDDGDSVRLPAPARRIVALTPHLAELTYAAGAGERLVATVERADYPPAAAELPRVGDAQALNLEAILLARPDLVLAWRSGNPPRSVARLHEFGIPVFHSEPRHVATVISTIERIGVLAGTRDKARARAAVLRQRLDTLRSAHRGLRPLRVFYQMWDHPLMTLGGPHLITEIIGLCGGENVFGDIDALAPTVDIEAVLMADPEVILAAGPADAVADWLAQWRQWPELKAVSQHHLVRLDPDLLHRPGPRVVRGAERLCAALDAARADP